MARTRLPPDVAAALRTISTQLQGPAGELPQDLEGDRQLSQEETKKLWLPLLRLRQACCHPQASSATAHVQSFHGMQLPCAAEPRLLLPAQPTRLAARPMQHTSLEDAV